MGSGVGHMFNQWCIAVLTKHHNLLNIIRRPFCGAHDCWRPVFLECDYVTCDYLRLWLCNMLEAVVKSYSLRGIAIVAICYHLESTLGSNSSFTHLQKCDFGLCVHQHRFVGPSAPIPAPPQVWWPWSYPGATEPCANTALLVLTCPEPQRDALRPHKT